MVIFSEILKKRQGVLASCCFLKGSWKMEIYIFKDQVVFWGKVKDLLRHIEIFKREYRTVQELIKANLP